MLEIKTRYGAKLSKTSFILFMFSANKHRIKKTMPITITTMWRLTFGINRHANSTMAVNAMIMPANRLVRPKVR